MTTLVTGATGLIGRALLPLLHNPLVLSRSTQGANSITCDLNHNIPTLPNGIGTVVHLAGESVAQHRWSDSAKRRIMSSRVEGTKNLVTALSKLSSPPQTLISASAVGYYGDCGDTLLSETSPAGDDFLAEVCQAWEAEAREAEALGMRVVQLRFGIILAKEGGALSKMLPPFRLGLGGSLGSGEQWMSWIHLHDVIGMILHTMAHKEYRGPMNVVAPEPLRHKEFVKHLGHILERPTVMHVPAFALKIGLGEMSSMLLSSQRVSAQAAIHLGYIFKFPTLSTALKNILST